MFPEHSFEKNLFPFSLSKACRHCKCCRCSANQKRASKKRELLPAECGREAPSCEQTYTDIHSTLRGSFINMGQFPSSIPLREYRTVIERCVTMSRASVGKKNDRRVCIGAALFGDRCRGHHVTLLSGGRMWKERRCNKQWYCREQCNATLLLLIIAIVRLVVIVQTRKRFKITLLIRTKHNANFRGNPLRPLSSYKTTLKNLTVKNEIQTRNRFKRTLIYYDIDNMMHICLNLMVKNGEKWDVELIHWRMLACCSHCSCRFPPEVSQRGCR